MIEPLDDCIFGEPEVAQAHGPGEPHEYIVESGYRRLWIEANGYASVENMVLHHRCHNPQCINLKHLVPMTRYDHDVLHGRRKPASWQHTYRTTTTALTALPRSTRYELIAEAAQRVQ